MVGVLDALKPGAPRRVRRHSGQRLLSTGSSATRRRPMPRSARPRTSRASAWSTTGWSAIRWSRARRSANTIAARGHYTLWTTSQFPHIVKLLMGNFVLNIPQHKLRVVSPDVGGGFGVKQFHYAEEAVVTWACAQGRPAGEVGLRAQRRLHLRRARPRPRDRSRAGARRERQVPRPARQHASPTWAAICRRSARTFRPISTDLLLAGVYTTPAIYCEVKGVFTNTRAGRCLSRRRPAGGDLRAGASGRRRGDRDGDRQGRDPPPQHDPDARRIRIRRRS